MVAGSGLSLPAAGPVSAGSGKGAGAMAGPGGGATAQAPSRPIRPAARARGRGRDNRDMWLILLEALGALALLVVIVWWTMFAGRKAGERRPEDDPPA